MTYFIDSIVDISSHTVSADGVLCEIMCRPNLRGQLISVYMYVMQSKHAEKSFITDNVKSLRQADNLYKCLHLYLLTAS